MRHALRSTNPVLFLLCILLLPSVPAPAQTGSLVLGIAQFDASALAPDLAYVGALIPSELMKRLSFLENSMLSENAYLAILQNRTLAEVKQARTRLSTLRKERDALYFKVMDPLQKSVALRNKEKELAAELLKLRDIESKEPNDSAGSVLALTPFADNAAGVLLPVVDNASATAGTKKIDFLVYGRCWQRNEYLGYEIVVYNAILRQEIFRHSYYTSSDDIDASLDESIRPLADAIVGSPYTIVKFSVFPVHATLVLDGKVLTGLSEIFYSEGEHTLVIQASGFEPHRETFSVRPGTDTTLSAMLDYDVPDPFLLESVPSGATLYIDAQKIGTTPIAVGGNAQTRIFRLEAEGYDASQIVVDSSPIAEPIVLEKNNGLTHEENFNGEKDRFYRGLGYFVASLPVSILSFGIFRMYYQTLESIQGDLDAGGLSQEAFDRAGAELEPKYWTSQTVFWSSLGASVLLMGNAVFRLVLYIDSAN